LKVALNTITLTLAQIIHMLNLPRKFQCRDIKIEHIFSPVQENVHINLN
jgi:hypothetical protein